MPYSVEKHGTQYMAVSGYTTDPHGDPGVGTYDTVPSGNPGVGNYVVLPGVPEVSGVGQYPPGFYPPRRGYGFGNYIVSRGVPEVSGMMLNQAYAAMGRRGQMSPRFSHLGNYSVERRGLQYMQVSGFGASADPQIEAVKKAQRLLKAAGYDPGPIDGKYGPKTDAAMSKWLADNPSTGTGFTIKNLGLSDEEVSLVQSAYMYYKGTGKPTGTGGSGGSGSGDGAGPGSDSGYTYPEIKQAGVGQFFQDYWWAFAVGAVAIVGGVWYMKRKKATPVYSAVPARDEWAF